MKIILAHGYIPHVVSRKREALSKQRHLGKRVGRWVMEACHGWFNKFRKLLVRCEKLRHTFLAIWRSFVAGSAPWTCLFMTQLFRHVGLQAIRDWTKF